MSEPEIKGRIERTENERMAAMIRRYWRDRGFEIDVQACRQSYNREGRAVSYWIIKSNLRNGLPV